MRRLTGYLGFLFTVCFVVSMVNAEIVSRVVRPSMHFTPPTNWMNDPNGMVYFDGEYHLFYQHYPEDLVWGPMHWGHAVSRNLIDWVHLPIALYPDELGMIFSGSVVVDHANTSGLGQDGSPAMVAIFTYHDEKAKVAGDNDFQSQGLAYSLDKGRSWIKYAHNPVLPNHGLIDFRDPKVTWHEPSQRWIMVLTQGDEVGFYSSKDLLNWRHESDFGKGYGAHGGVWECPDLIRIGDRYVLIVSLVPGGPNGGSATQYFIGDFDGTAFKPSKQHRDAPERVLWLDWGPDNYAGVTFSNTEVERHFPVFMGWANNWAYATNIPATTWRSMMTLPRELFLFEKESWELLGTRPIEDVDQFMRPQVFGGSNGHVLPSGHAFKLSLIFDGSLNSSATLVLSNSHDQRISLELNSSSNDVTLDRRYSGDMNFSDAFPMQVQAKYAFDRKHTQIDFYYDGNLIEIFIDGGRSSITSQIFPNETLTNLSIHGMKLGKVLVRPYQD